MISRLSAWFSAQKFPVRMVLFSIPVVGLIAFAILAGAPADDEWVTIADGKDAALVEQMRQKLSSKGISVQAGGLKLQVRRQDQSRAVMTLAGEGVMSDAELFRFLEDSNFTSTHWQMDKRWQVALQRKLERMIRELDSIQDAYVQITPATEAKTLGVKDAEGGKASVVVTLKPGRSELGASEIQGIAHLVSAGVRGLKPEGVKIMDRQGRLYKTLAEDARWSSVSDRHAMERRYEKDLEDKAHRVVLSAYPQATVSAFVKLSSRRIVQRETQVGSDGATKVVEEASTNGSSMKGLKSLSLSELPPVEGAAHETRRQVEIEPGEVEHASMAIAIPLEQVPANFAAEEERLRRLVANATGIADADISVQVIPAASRGSDEPLPAASPVSDPISPVWVAMGASIVLLALLAFAARRPRADALAALRPVVREMAARAPESFAARLKDQGPRGAALILTLVDADMSRRLLGAFDAPALQNVLVEMVKLGQKPPRPQDVKAELARLAWVPEGS